VRCCLPAPVAIIFRASTSSPLAVGYLAADVVLLLVLEEGVVEDTIDSLVPCRFFEERRKENASAFFHFKTLDTRNNSKHKTDLMLLNQLAAHPKGYNDRCGVMAAVNSNPEYPDE